MLDKKLGGVKIAKSKASIDLSNPKKCSNILLGERLKKGYSAQNIFDGIIEDKIARAYSLFGGTFIQTQTGDFIEFYKGNIHTYYNFLDKAYAIETNLNGQRKAFVFAKNQGVLLNLAEQSFQPVFLPSDCHDGVFFDKRLYLRSNDGIVFSKREDLTNFTPYNDAGGFINPSNDGKILSLQVLGNTLYLFFERGIYQLKKAVRVTDIQLERLNIKHLAIKENSVATLNDKIYFIQDDYLHSFDGEKIEKISSHLQNNKCLEITSCGVVDDNIFYQGIFENSQHNCTLIINPNSNDCYAIENLPELSKTDGLVADKTHEKLCVLSLNDSDADYYFLSHPQNLGKSGIKNITCIRLETKYPARLNVTGKFGSIVFYFDCGYSVKKCNITSDYFNFEITSSAPDVNVGNLTVDYYLKGE